VIVIPVTYKLEKGILTTECERWNQLARAWEDKNFATNHFNSSTCGAPPPGRRLDESYEELLPLTIGNHSRMLTDTTSALASIYSTKFAPLQKIKNALYGLELIESTIEAGWKAGTRDIVLVIAEVIDFFQDIMDTIGTVMQVVLGPVIDVLGAVIDKVRSSRLWKGQDGLSGYISTVIPYLLKNAMVLIKYTLRITLRAPY
jgi:hypothetical protein